MITSKEEFAVAADQIKDRTVALVYAHSFDDQVLHAYYLRQRTEILSGYADVIDLLGAYPVFYNLDQFIELCAHTEQLAKIDYVINVPGGSLELDLLTIVSTLANKVRKPVFPATATSISLGQNKPIARCLARDAGWPVPRSVLFDEAAGFPGTLILKPKYAGDSYGIRVVKRPKLEDLPQGNQYTLEEFIEGYDFTAYIMFSTITKRHEVLGASVTIPADPNDRRWYWDNESKFKSSGRGVQRFHRLTINRESCRTSQAFDSLSRRTCELFGVFSVARIDFRLPEWPTKSGYVDVPDCMFLELNVLPSITPSGSWQHYIKAHLASHSITEDDVHPLLSQLPPMQAAMLYVFLSWIIQRDGGSATGVDQLK